MLKREPLTYCIAFPTAVGMNRLFSARYSVGSSVPHSRGDEPLIAGLNKIANQRSPQPWG